MNRTGLALMAIILAGSATLTPAQAVPPTATPSPGYDARLQEQRKATTSSSTSTVIDPATPPAYLPPRHHTKGKKPRN